MRNIVVMPGDGIGKVVIPQALRILEKVGFQANYIEADIGWECWTKEGNPLPQKTVDLLKEHRVGLFGAITSKPKDEATKELSAELQDKGYVYYSPIVALRQIFDLHICIRPCQTFEGNPLNFIRRKGDNFEEPVVNSVIFRQNTQGLYAGVEWTHPPVEVRSAMESHPKMKAFKNVASEDLAISCRIFTRQACRAIVEEAFRYAKKEGYSSVTVCEKPNVVRETSGMMRDEAKKVARDFSEIPLYFTNIDAQMMWLTKNPEDYGVIVAGNLFGDIISDGFAGLVGGLGFACSANLGSDCAIFEPTHGSAPKYADYPTSIVNPIAMILSGCMMLDYLDEQEKARAIRKAITEVIQEGRVRTYDMMKLRGCPEVIDQGAGTTVDMTDAILAKL